MRRAAVISVAVLACVVVGVLVVGAQGADPSDRSRVRRPRSEPVTRARIRVAWSQPVRGWPSQITADGAGVVAVSGGRFVSALRPGDGSRGWEAEVPGWLSPFIEPAIDADAVLLSAGDRFVALDRADGAIRWEVPAGGEARGVALVPESREPESPGEVVAVTATSDGHLTGRDVATGAPRWTMDRGGTLDAHLATDPATGLVVAIWQTPGAATVRAVDVASGALRWEQQVEPMVSSPVMGGDAVVVAAGDGDYRASIRALDLADGRLRWATSVPASFEPDLVPGVDLHAGRPGGTVAGEVAVQDHLGTVSLLDLGTGALRWRTETGVPALGGRLVLTPRAVVIRNEGQQLVILDRARGRVRSRRTDPDGLPEAIAGSGTQVLVAWRWTEPGRIDALEIEISPSGP